MPDNTYKWVIYDYRTREPELIFQRKYELKAWIKDREDLDMFTIFRFPPYGPERVELDTRTLEPIK